MFNRNELFVTKKLVGSPSDAPSKQSVQRIKVVPSSRTFTAVSKMVTATWRQDLIGQGKDAKGLTHQRIRIKEILHIENVSLLKKYEQKKQELCQQGIRTKVPPIKGLTGEAEITTLELGIFYIMLFVGNENNSIF